MKLLKIYACFVILGIIITNVIFYLFRDSTEEYIKKELGIDISFCTIKEEHDDHGGFLGDGSYFLVADCENDKENILSQLKDWKKFPLSGNLQKAVYGEEYSDGQMYYSFSSLCKGKIPTINNGYYYFFDRFKEAIDVYSDKDFLDRFSYNFTIALYDEDTNLFYYYELDT